MKQDDYELFKMTVLILLLIAVWALGGKNERPSKRIHPLGANSWYHIEYHTVGNHNRTLSTQSPTP